MPIKYIGRTTYQVGKTLWEIIGNLKNFGVGRIITRGTSERYAEPCYIRICKVETCPNEDPRKVKVWAEKVFRGHKYSEIVQVHSTSYKPDYKLVPKDEEEAFIKYSPVQKEVVILPQTAPLPPLLRELVIRDMKSRGRPVKEPQMTLLYRQGKDNMAKIAQEGLPPTVKIDLGLGKPASPQLYEGLL